jgi:hypothetical protein
MKVFSRPQVSTSICSIAPLRSSREQAFGFYRKMATAAERSEGVKEGSERKERFLPKELRVLVNEVAGLLRERKESVAETVCSSHFGCEETI